MLPDKQREVNARITDAMAIDLLDGMNTWLGAPIEYKVAEMPIMVSDAFRRELESAATGIIMECVGGQEDHPLFSVTDFAVCDDGEGGYMPKLIELQGFPSLMGYQLMLSEQYIAEYAIDGVTPFLSGLDHDGYIQMLRTAIYADADPAACVLMEVDPDTQKTRPDFLALQNYIGLRTVNIRDVRKDGRKLVVPIDGKLVALERVFNRAIIDELDDLGVQISFDWNNDLDVQWAGHPSWYFRISKENMQTLTHPAVPKSTLLSRFDVLPANLNDYVLKPLYAFAGKGVVVGPTEADVRAVPRDQLDGWMLQERVTYADCVPTPMGTNKVEIRIMLTWYPDAPAPIPVISLARTGRGLLMGSRYNTEPWTGSSACLFSI